IGHEGGTSVAGEIRSTILGSFLLMLLLELLLSFAWQTRTKGSRKVRGWDFRGGVSSTLEMRTANEQEREQEHEQEGGAFRAVGSGYHALAASFSAVVKAVSDSSRRRRVSAMSPLR